MFVTHSIPEAVFLSSRVVVMSAAAGPDHEDRGHRPAAPARTTRRARRERYFALITEVREALRAGGGDVDDEAAAASARRTLAEGAVG